jgi:hypothetical protein
VKYLITILYITLISSLTNILIIIDLYIIYLVNNLIIINIKLYILSLYFKASNSNIKFIIIIFYNLLSFKNSFIKLYFLYYNILLY